LVLRVGSDSSVDEVQQRAEEVIEQVQRSRRCKELQLQQLL